MTRPQTVALLIAGWAAGASAQSAAQAPQPASPSTLQSTPQPASRQGANQLTSAERAAGWHLLFDGSTLAGWRGLGYASVPTAHWKVVDGAIQKVASQHVARMPDGQPANGGDLMTIGTFRDFELTFEWRVPPGANSGVKYNVSEEISRRTANHAALGFEYQVLDDSLNDDNKVATHRAGALYDIIAPSAEKHLVPVGQWNRSRIILRGNHGEHWLNGRMIVSYDLGTPRLDSLLAASKYRSIAAFAERRAGHIVLQDHGDAAWYRELKIRELTK